MGKIKTSFLDERRADVVAALADYNAALKTNDASTLRASINKLKDAEAEYATQKAKEVYLECAEQENPMLYAIQKYSYEILSHKEDKEDGVVVSASLDEHKVRVIDLYSMCMSARIGVEWSYAAQQHNLSMLLSQTRKLGFTEAQVKEVSNSYYLDKKLREAKDGKNPVSKNSLLAGLQGVVDAVFEPYKMTGAYKVNNHDLAYMEAVYCRKGKKALTVNASNHTFYRRILMDVLHRVVCDLRYGLEFDIVNGEGKREAGCIFAGEEKPVASATATTVSAPASKPIAAESKPVEAGTTRLGKRNKKADKATPAA